MIAGGRVAGDHGRIGHSVLVRNSTAPDGRVELFCRCSCRISSNRCRIRCRAGTRRPTSRRWRRPRSRRGKLPVCFAARRMRTEIVSDMPVASKAMLLRSVIDVLRR